MATLPVRSGRCHSLSASLRCALHSSRALSSFARSRSLSGRQALLKAALASCASLSELLLRLSDQSLSCLALRHMRVCLRLCACVCASRLVLSLSRSVPVGALSPSHAAAAAATRVHQKLSDSRRHKTCVSHNSIE